MKGGDILKVEFYKKINDGEEEFLFSKELQLDEVKIYADLLKKKIKQDVDLNLSSNEQAYGPSVKESHYFSEEDNNVIKKVLISYKKGKQITRDMFNRI